MTGIYRIESPSNKIYIGQSVNIKNRWKQYRVIKRWDAQPVIGNSFKKYGIDNHVFSVAIECPETISPNQLTSLEKALIHIIKITNTNGVLNCASPINGHRFSKESKEKMSVVQKTIAAKTPRWNAGKKNVYTAEANEKRSRALMGHSCSEKVKESNRIKKKGNKNRLGKAHSDETKNKISVSKKANPTPIWNKGKKWGEESRKKMSNSRMGKEPWNKGKKSTFKHSEEHKEKLKIRMKKYWEDRKNKSL